MTVPQGSPGSGPRRPWLPLLLPTVAAVLLLVLGWVLLSQGAGPTRIGYGKLVQQIAAKRVATLTIDGDGTIAGTYRPGYQHGAAFVTHYPTGIGGPDPVLLAQIRDPALVPTVTASGVSSSWLIDLIGYLPLVLVLLLLWSVGRSSGGGRFGALMGFGRSKATVVDATRPDVSFADIAGYDGVKQEVGEIIDFLRDPGRYRAAGAEGPRGVLMVGPPGTGKTLFARAVAGEASVPFFSVTASSFVEVFVGVGASRVRDLFDQARKRAPAIVFIDEIDAIGERRGLRVGTNDEREQTLNQLLAEMDGFERAGGVVVLAATNRPDVLDPALLRPGRFDRQVVVPLPNRRERAAILATHARDKRLAADVDLAALAGATPGLSGADLAGLANEAAIGAARDRRTEITAEDFAAARDRLVLGRRQPAGFLLEEERRNVAVHESGHALAAELVPLADPVDRVTILPSGFALGATEQLPTEERHLFTEARLRADLVVRLAGRAAELVVFGEGSSGAASDLAEATRLAARMVTEFGLSSRIGPVALGEQRTDPDPSGPFGVRQYSEATQRIVDTEIAALLAQADQQAVRLLRAHRTALDRLVDELIEHETLSGEVVARIAAESAATPPPSPARPAEAGERRVLGLSPRTTARRP